MKMLCVVSAILSLATSLGAQTPDRYGVVDPVPRRELAQDWDAVDPKQLERGFCAEYKVELLSDGHIRYRVTSVHEAQPIYANPYAVSFECPVHMVKGHVHTPTTCKQELMRGVLLATCYIGGDDAYICRPSPTDQTNLDHDEFGRPFGIVQCDRHALIFYFPSK